MPNDPDDSRTIPNAAFLTAVREAREAGATDAAGGGVPISEVATRLAITERTARHRLTHLAEAGSLDRVWGLSSEGFRPRVSYLLADDQR